MLRELHANNAELMRAKLMVTRASEKRAAYDDLMRILRQALFACEEAHKVVVMAGEALEEMDDLQRQVKPLLELKAFQDSRDTLFFGVKDAELRPWSN